MTQRRPGTSKVVRGWALVNLPRYACLLVALRKYLVRKGTEAHRLNVSMTGPWPGATRESRATRKQML